MKRTQIYISPEQYNFLEDVAFITSRKEQKRVSISEIIRKAINLLKEQYIRNKSEEKELSYLKTRASRSLQEVWDNEQDSIYDKL